QLFIAMEFVDGVTLSSWMKYKRTPAEVLGVLSQAGRGLAAAHAAGLVHRDFKPSNVLIGHDGRVRVADFGLARILPEAPAGSPALPAPRAAASEISRTGSLVGTPAYMAPEQFSGIEPDARTDQFSFCVVLYEALVGKRPFQGETLEALAKSVVEGK